jgi:tRNA A37 methylthiotransferase MiaB
MRDQIDETIKKERAKRLELIAKEASLAFSRSLKGSHMRALVIDQARAICDNGIELPGVFSEDMVNNFIDINTLR